MQSILNDEERVQIALGLGQVCIISVYGWVSYHPSRSDKPAPFISIKAFKFSNASPPMDDIIERIKIKYDKAIKRIWNYHNTPLNCITIYYNGHPGWSCRIKEGSEVWKNEYENDFKR